MKSKEKYKEEIIEKIKEFFKDYPKDTLEISSHDGGSAQLLNNDIEFDELEVNIYGNI